MIDFKKYSLDENNVEFLKDLYACVECQNEIDLRYKENFVFTFCPSGSSVFIYDDKPDNPQQFDNLDEMLLNFMIDGKPFIEQIDEIDYA